MTGLAPPRRSLLTLNPLGRNEELEWTAPHRQKWQVWHFGRPPHSPGCPHGLSPRRGRSEFWLMQDPVCFINEVRPGVGVLQSHNRRKAVRVNIYFVVITGGPICCMLNGRQFCLKN
ncbi:hypothetical protein AVEN_252379-1 [Araneus ventricosus]|uniref:U-box domain-containing protein n=1 Tax=Araneus ventricosus TaxID=182803 RepID=A0A4Y2ARR1_ARAVE|nr:hypothetical protein AVEN_252379-1 [Araneus ventricosus]